MTDKTIEQARSFIEGQVHTEQTALVLELDLVGLLETDKMLLAAELNLYLFYSVTPYIAEVINSEPANDEAIVVSAMEADWVGTPKEWTTEESLEHIIKICT